MQRPDLALIIGGSSFIWDRTIEFSILLPLEHAANVEFKRWVAARSADYDWEECAGVIPPEKRIHGFE